MSGVQSVDRALAILRALGSGPAGVTELAERLSLPKSTVSRMLSTLEANAAVEQGEAGGRYRLGPLMAAISAAMAPTRSLVAVAEPILAELTRTIGEAAGLAVPEGRNALCIAEVRPEHDVQVRDWTGTLAPMHSVPAGLVFLAHLPATDLDGYLAAPLEATTDSTMVDRARLRKRLVSIAKGGSTWVYGEFSADLNSVAAPVYGRDGALLAAIHVHGPSFRYPAPDRAATIEQLVREAAARLSDRLQHQP